MLILQTGNSLTVPNTGRGGYQSILSDKGDLAIAPAVSAVDFFTQFADQSRSTFTWSKSMPAAEEAFIAERAAMYLGLASENELIRLRNANLNFDVTVVPQRGTDNLRRTLGKFNAIGVVANSGNKPTAFRAAFLIAGRDNAASLADLTGLPPVRRDLLAQTVSDDLRPVLYRSALISRSWRDPDPLLTENIFGQMAEDALLKRKTANEAVNEADSQIDNLLKNR